MQRTLTIFGISVALFVFLALLIGFSTNTVTAREVGTIPNLCERFSSLSRILPSCQEPEPTPTPPPPAPQPPPPAPPPAPPPTPDEERSHNICKRYSFSSRLAPPSSCDVCLNVPGVQLDEPCADKVCTDDGGTWEGVSCVFPPPDVCPNVPGNQPVGPCADEQCQGNGGTWNGASCVFPQGAAHIVRESPDLTGSVSGTFGGTFSISLEGETAVMGPLSFTITTTGMDNVTHLLDVRLTPFTSKATTLMGPHDVSLTNGVGLVTFTEQVSLDVGQSKYHLIGSIPPEERPGVEHGATIIVSANPVDDWTVIGSLSGVAIPLDPASLIIGKRTIDKSSGGGGGGIIIDASSSAASGGGASSGSN